MTVEQNEKGSFVEKALSRLKRQQQEMAPLAEIRDESRPGAAEPAVAAAPMRVVDAAKANVVDSGAASRVIAVDRKRLLDEGFLAPEDYQRRLADEYRLIKRPLIANAFGVGVTRVEDGNLILISSAVSGEGKTHTCINLALSLAAETDRNVLLVDGDVAKPHISRLFGVVDEPGLLDALRLLCRELADRYQDRIVLFDSPPLLATTEAQAIAQSVGQVVVVIAENSTGRDDVSAALDLLDKRKPINAILNKSRQPSVGGYHYGGYGYGAHGNARRVAAGEEPE